LPLSMRSRTDSLHRTCLTKGLPCPGAGHPGTRAILRKRSTLTMPSARRSAGSTSPLSRFGAAGPRRGVPHVRTRGRVGAHVTRMARLKIGTPRRGLAARGRSIVEIRPTGITSRETPGDASKSRSGGGDVSPVRGVAGRGAGPSRQGGGAGWLSCVPEADRPRGAACHATPPSRIESDLHGSRPHDILKWLARLGPGEECT